MFSLFKKREVPEALSNMPDEALDVSLLPLPEPTKVESQFKSLPAQKKSSNDSEKGFFKDLIKNVTDENTDLNEVDSWYANKFLPGDIVCQMREYWENQQPELLFKNFGGELKTKLNEKSEKMHKLEGEWQEIYFSLLSKEKEIRKEEKELKESLSEFLILFKNSVSKDKSLEKVPSEINSL